MESDECFDGWSGGGWGGIYSPQPSKQLLGVAAVDGRTGQSGVPIDSSPSPTVVWWLRAINTPQPPPLQPSKHSTQCIQYKSNRLHSKDTIQVIDPLKVSNSTLAHLDL